MQGQQRWSSGTPLTARDLDAALARLDRFVEMPDGRVHFRRRQASGREVVVCAPRARVACFLSLSWLTGRRIRSIIGLRAGNITIGGSDGDSIVVRWARLSSTQESGQEPGVEEVEYPGCGRVVEEPVGRIITYHALLMRDPANPAHFLFPGRSRKLYLATGPWDGSRFPDFVVL